jgi:hypothetical protein
VIGCNLEDCGVHRTGPTFHGVCASPRCECATRCDEPAPLVAGAIARSLADAADGGLWAAYERYCDRLEQQGRRGGPDPGPWDD